MKYFWFLVFCFLLMFSCGKKTAVVAPEPIPQKYTIETIVVSGNGKISSSATEVLAGAGITITLQPDFGYLLPKIIVVNGNSVEMVSNIVTFIVTKNTKAEVSFPADPVVVILTAKSWVSDSTYVQGIGYKSTAGITLTFYPDGSKITKFEDGQSFKGSWSVVGDVLISGGLEYRYILANNKLRMIRPLSVEVYK